jgi:hypothetical protein
MLKRRLLGAFAVGAGLLLAANCALDATGELGPGEGDGGDAAPFDGAMAEAAWVDASAPDTGCDPLTWNLSADPHNCGSCGHDCLTTSCEAGACVPVFLATGQDEPKGLAVSGGIVYWSTVNDSVVHACIADSCDASVILADAQAQPMRLLVQNGRLFWSNNVQGGGIHACVVDGGGGCTTAKTFVPADYPLALAGDSTYLYWTTTPATGPGTLEECAFDAAPCTAIRMAESPGQPFQIALSAGFAYFSDFTNGVISRCPIDGGCQNKTSPEHLVVDASQPVGLAVDGMDMVWASSGTGTIMHSDRNGLGGTVLASNQGGPGAVVIDSQWVFWTNIGPAPDGGGSGSGVFKCSRGGCPDSGPIPLVQLPRTWTIRLDESGGGWVYFLTGNVGGPDASASGIVGRVPK